MAPSPLRTLCIAGYAGMVVTPRVPDAKFFTGDQPKSRMKNSRNVKLLCVAVTYNILFVTHIIMQQYPRFEHTIGSVVKVLVHQPVGLQTASIVFGTQTTMQKKQTTNYRIFVAKHVCFFSFFNIVFINSVSWNRNAKNTAKHLSLNTTLQQKCCFLFSCH